jgi:MFS family permease
VLPYVVFGLFAGIAGDRLPRRLLIWVSHALEAAFAITVPLWAFTAGSPPVVVVAISAFMIGACRVFADAGAFGAVSALVGPEGFTTGQSLLSSSWAVGMLIGPAIGGILIGTLGPAETLVVQSAAFALASLLILAVRSDFGRPEPTGAGLLDGVAEGVRFIVADPLLRTLTGTGFCWNIVAAGTWALMVPLLRNEVGLTAHETGLVLGLGAIAAFAAAPVLHLLQRHYTGVDLYVRFIFISAIPTIAVGLAAGFAAAALAVMALYLVNFIEMSVFIGERQRRAPAELQSRVGISGRMLMTTSMAIGGFLASGLTGLLTLRELYVAMGLASIGVGLLSVRRIARAVRTLAAVA